MTTDPAITQAALERIEASNAHLEKELIVALVAGGGMSG